MNQGPFPRLPDVGVVVAGDDGHIMRPSQAFQPCARLDALTRRPEMCEVPCDGDVIGAYLFQVFQQGVKDACLMMSPPFEAP